MIVVTIELWPHGDKEQAQPLGVLTIANDGTGDDQVGHYDVTASHAGVYFGRRREPYRTGKVRGFPRRFSPYRLVCRALRAIGEL